MFNANTVRVTKIKVAKDKRGKKTATIQLTRVVEVGEQLTPLLREAVDHMEAHEKITKMQLSERIPRRNLLFWPSNADLGTPSDLFPCVELNNFRLRREGNSEKEETSILMTWEFTVPLDDARRWLIPAIGDDIVCVVEDANLTLG
jgi:hypothetical protein